jgi:hypothetical protein
VLGGLIVLLLSAPAQSEVSRGQPIGRIIIESEDIFNTADPSEDRALYRMANVLHIQTQKSVIQRELLFKEGDPYDPDLVLETERNLRQFNFLRRVKITPQETADGKVDLLVHTKDTWTLEPQFNFSRVGNRSSTKIGLVERNLLGSGKRLSAFVNRGPDGTDNSFAYRDQQFLGRSLELSGDYINGTDFREYGASVSKPFRSSLSRYSFEVSNFFSEENLPAYQDGREIGRFEKEGRVASVQVGRSFGSTPKLTRQGTLGFRQETRRYEPVSGNTEGFLKPPLDLSVIEPGFNWQKLEFIKERHIEKFDRDEDFNLGAGVGVSLGLGQDWEENKKTEGVPQLSAHVGHLFGPGHFALVNARYRSRISNDRTDNLLANVDVQYFNRLQPQQTLAGHLAYDHGYRLDPEEQLLLGEDTGLRAYSIGQFSGERRVLFNLEDRLFLSEDVLHLMSFGAAAFFDSGLAWGSSRNVNLSDLRSSVGVGFRIAMSRSSRNEPIRIDLAYALNDNQQKSRLVLSFQSGVKFGGSPEKRSRL